MSLALALALALAAAPPPGADLLEKQAGARPAVLLAPREDPLGVLVVTFRTGIYDDGDKPGLTRLSQQALIGANERVPYETLVTDLYQSGASIDLETGVRACSIRLVAPRASFERLAQKVLGMVLQPSLDRDEIRRAARRLIAEDLVPGHSVTISALVARAVFPDDWRAHNELLVDPDAVETVSFDDLDKNIAERLTPANAQVVVTGAFDKAKMRAFLKRFHGGTPSKPIRVTGGAPVNIHYRSRSRVHVMAFPVNLSSATEVARVRVLAAMLEDRLFRKLRAAGKAYSLEVTVQHTEWLDFLMVVLPVSSGAMGIAAALQTETSELGNALFTDEELASNRTAVEADLAAADRDPLRLAAQLAMSGPAVSWLDARTVAAVHDLSRDDLRAFAKKTLAPENTIYILYGPNAAELTTPGSARH